MPILPKSERVAIAELVKGQPLHLAWGPGDGDWTTTVPPEDANAVGLITEFGRHTVTETYFVTPDEDGSIVSPQGNFSISPTPTSHVYFMTQFDRLNAQSDVIRQVGLFVGSTMIAGLPPGQNYFTPAEVETTGRLFYLANFQPIFRSPFNDESFSFVISF